MTEEIFEIFDQKNRLIGTAPRSEAHKKGLYHRGVNVFVVNNKGEIFLQRRSENKDTNPGKWCYGAGEHLKPGETYEEAAKRGLEEELGIKESKPVLIRGAKLIEVVHTNGKIDKEFDALFVVKAEGPFKLDPSEVAEGKFLKMSEIEEKIKSNSKEFTEFFLKEWEDFKKSFQNGFK